MTLEGELQGIRNSLNNPGHDQREFFRTVTSLLSRTRIKACITYSCIDNDHGHCLLRETIIEEGKCRLFKAKPIKELTEEEVTKLGIETKDFVEKKKQE